MTDILDKFIIIPPADKNAEVAARAAYLEARLTLEFRGYSFEVIDLRDLRSVDGQDELGFQESDRFSAVPVVGQVSEGAQNYIRQLPPQDLVDEIVRFCSSFDFAKARRAAA